MALDMTEDVEDTYYYYYDNTSSLNALLEETTPAVCITAIV